MNEEQKKTLKEELNSLNSLKMFYHNFKDVLEQCRKSCMYCEHSYKSATEKSLITKKMILQNESFGYPEMMSATFLNDLIFCEHLSQEKHLNKDFLCGFFKYRDTFIQKALEYKEKFLDKKPTIKETEYNQLKMEF